VSINYTWLSICQEKYRRKDTTIYSIFFFESKLYTPSKKRKFNSKAIQNYTSSKNTPIQKMETGRAQDQSWYAKRAYSLQCAVGIALLSIRYRCAPMAGSRRRRRRGRARSLQQGAESSALADATLTSRSAPSSVLARLFSLFSSY
jgi:hypothetical protein